MWHQNNRKHVRQIEHCSAVDSRLIVERSVIERGQSNRTPWCDALLFVPGKRAATQKPGPGCEDTIAGFSELQAKPAAHCNYEGYMIKVAARLWNPAL